MCASTVSYIVNSEEAEGHNVGTPFGSCSTGAATGSDAAAVKHYSHIVGSFWLAGLGRHYCGTEVETCLREQKHVSLW